MSCRVILTSTMSCNSSRSTAAAHLCQADAIAPERWPIDSTFQLFRHTTTNGVHGIEYLRLAHQELPQSILDKRFEMACRDTPAPRRGASASSGERLQDIVAVAR